jgi:hypothetical protein
MKNRISLPGSTGTGPDGEIDPWLPAVAVIVYADAAVVTVTANITPISRIYSSTREGKGRF